MKQSFLFFLFFTVLLSMQAQTIVDPQTFTSDTTVSDTDETYGRPSSTNKKFLMKYIRKYVRQGFSGDITVNAINGVVTLSDGVITNVKLASQTLDSNKLKNRAITPLKLNATGATGGQVLKYNSTTGLVEWDDELNGIYSGSDSLLQTNTYVKMDASNTQSFGVGYWPSFPNNDDYNVEYGLLILPNFTLLTNKRSQLQLQESEATLFYSIPGTSTNVFFSLRDSSAYIQGQRSVGAWEYQLPNSSPGSGNKIIEWQSGTPVWISTPSGGGGSSPERVFLESSTATSVDLDAGTTVKDRDGSNTTFTFPSNLSGLRVYKNGMLLAETGSLTTRDYSCNTGTNTITFTVALVSTDRVIIEK